MEYIQGNPVTLWEQFVDADGEPADPTTITFYVRDPAGDVVAYVFGVDAEVVKTTNNIRNPDGTPSEFFGATDGFYICNLDAPSIAGEYHYRPSGTGAVVAANEYEFSVIASSTLTPVTSGPQFAPFTAWCDPDDVILRCPGAAGSDTALLEQWVEIAGQVMFEKSGRQYTGLSQAVKVRPPNAPGCGCWPWNETWHSWGQISVGAFGWDWGLGRWGCGSNWYGCSPLSAVQLAGTAREIVQVKVNGDVLDADEYRLDGWRWLVRERDPSRPNVQLFWPSCQILDLPDTEDGTFSVTYRYGVDPPAGGKAAATALACELYKAAGGLECKLPPGTRRATRQGLALDISLFAQWQRDPTTGAWSVGIPEVDTFLNTYNPNGLRRPPSVWSPWTQPFPLVPGA